MTSDSTTSTAPSEPCPKCPGAGSCWLLRMLPRSAHVKGCRAPQAVAAQTEYSRGNRAGKAAQKAAQERAEITGGWEPAESPAPAEPTGEACSVCREPVYPIPTGAGLACRNGHYNRDLETARRVAASNAEREPAALAVRVTAEPNPEEIATTDIERERVIRVCIDAMKSIDYRQLTEITHNLNCPMYGHWSDILLSDTLVQFASYIKQAKTAQTRERIAAINTAVQNLVYSHTMNNLRAAVHAAFHTTVNELNKKNIVVRGTRNPIKYEVVMINQYIPRIRQIIHEAPPAIAAPNKVLSGRVEPREDDDSEYDDSEYDDSEYDNSEDGKDFNPW